MTTPASWAVRPLRDRQAFVEGSAGVTVVIERLLELEARTGAGSGRVAGLR